MLLQPKVKSILQQNLPRWISAILKSVCLRGLSHIYLFQAGNWPFQCLNVEQVLPNHQVLNWKLGPQPEKPFSLEWILSKFYCQEVEAVV